MDNLKLQLIDGKDVFEEDMKKDGRVVCFFRDGGVLYIEKEE